MVKPSDDSSLGLPWARMTQLNCASAGKTYVTINNAEWKKFNFSKNYAEKPCLEKTKVEWNKSLALSSGLELDVIFSQDLC